MRAYRELRHALIPSPRGTVRTVARIGGLAVVIAVALYAAGTAFAWAHAEFGYHPDLDAQKWAGLTAQYAETAICQSCHEVEFAAWRTSQHAGVSCETCHGPLRSHATTAEMPTTIKVEKPSSDLCATCHQRALGRPAAFPQIDLAVHYNGAACLRCHDAHSTKGANPPPVTHPLANLPECVACHGAQGLKPMPVDHAVAEDGVCLGCHGARANPH